MKNELMSLTGEVVSFKLNSGEELIGRVEDFQDGVLSLSDPVSVAPGPQGMGLVPSLFTSDGSRPVRLNSNSIALFVETAEPIRLKYIEATTGIAVPNKQIITG